MTPDPLAYHAHSIWQPVTHKAYEDKAQHRSLMALLLDNLHERVAAAGCVETAAPPEVRWYDSRDAPYPVQWFDPETNELFTVEGMCLLVETNCEGEPCGKP